MRVLFGLIVALAGLYVCSLAGCGGAPKAKPGTVDLTNSNYEHRSSWTSDIYPNTPRSGQPPITSGVTPPPGPPAPNFYNDRITLVAPAPGTQPTLPPGRYTYEDYTKSGTGSATGVNDENSKSGMRLGVTAEGGVTANTTGSTPPPAVSQALAQMQPLVWVGAGLIVAGVVMVALKSQPWMAWAPAGAGIAIAGAGVVLCVLPYITEKYSWVLVVLALVVVVWQAWAHGLFKNWFNKAVSPEAQKNAALDGNPEAAGPLEYLRTKGNKQAAKRAQVVAQVVASNHGTTA